MIAGSFLFREISVAVQQLGPGFHPVIHKSLLQLRDHRTLHLIMRIAPQAMGPPIAFPGVGDSHSADEPEVSIDHENLAMRPKIDA